MRSVARTATGLAVAVLLVAVPPATAQAPAGDSVTGDLFDRDTGLQVFVLDVHSDPSGGNPSGTLEWHVGGGLGPTWTATVTCLSVSGSTAVIGFSGTMFFLGDLRPTAGLIRVVDGGGPSSALDSFETAETQGSPNGAPIPGPTDCSSYPSSFTPSDSGVNHSGDITVIDAPPLPVTKDQCKNGGWRTYGVFENQGDCVSFVRHQAHQACIFERVAHGVAAFRVKYGIGPQQQLAMWACVHRRIGF
jgi:hypothetical protein